MFRKTHCYRARSIPILLGVTRMFFEDTRERLMLWLRVVMLSMSEPTKRSFGLENVADLWRTE